MIFFKNLFYFLFYLLKEPRYGLESILFANVSANKNKKMSFAIDFSNLYC
ncbi:hypothetical protein SPJ2_1301 [Streptococcus parauberis KRS-02109]|nr:hypothetical protein SPJ2_1301 [Streptococcus parauberis KRS-02109]